MLLADVQSFTGQALHVYMIVIATFYCYWRALKLSSAGTQPDHIKRLLKVGGVLTLAVLVARALLVHMGGTLHYTVELFILLPFAFLCVLGALGLSQVIYLRKNNSNGLQSSIRMQESFILAVMAGVGVLFLVITLLVSGASSGGPGAGIVAISTFLVNIFAAFATAILIAIVWFLSLFVFPSAKHVVKVFTPCKTPAPVPHHLHIHIPPQKQCEAMIPAPMPAFDALPYIKAVVLLLVILIIGLVIWAIVRRLKRVRTFQGQLREVRESFWSWNLVWTQIQMLVRSLWLRLFPHSAHQQEEQSGDEWDSNSIQTVQSIRDIYRAFLKHAATRGYPHQKDETPYEFRQRLEQQTRQAQGHVVVITEAYIAIRYAGSVPAEQDVARVRQEWAELERMWLAEKRATKSPLKR